MTEALQQRAEAYLAKRGLDFVEAAAKDSPRPDPRPPGRECTATCLGGISQIPPD